MPSRIGNALFGILWLAGMVGIGLDMGWWWALGAGVLLPLSALAGVVYSIGYLDAQVGIWAAVGLWLIVIVGVSIAFKLSR